MNRTSGKAPKTGGVPKNRTVRSPEEIAAVYERQMPTVWRVCRTYMKNEADTEDAAADTFAAFVASSPAFESEEHEKAWLIRTASNVCVSMLRRASRKVESLDALAERGETGAGQAYEASASALSPGPSDLKDPGDRETRELWEAVDSLPERYRISVYLHYYEGYRTDEIASMLGKPSSTVRNWLSEARKILRERLREGE
ncbi:MAG: sigma-70 family RNA polymerase sigma factor [Ruminococcaceae bacterium]|jgi:RNA polymerase sigma-70 factor (ECF subfamily)|nr:sigma-70 family RNA polymerase sigma factor [Oscillospiraceae bacterium]